ncbi:hypothetical protein SAMN04488038_10147 [Solimonas aquatica]|uniref:Uncharacterized protein n=1 Tax=Solimonas aquatica TaxID=489703 RepID=A0A1H8ZHK6_9GAMM|nr:hypothetical protein [Solimonas aquatica]SEP64019.1 hypothetical protein SAMN04488038_10147 [Solimonas aquatica]
MPVHIGEVNSDISVEAPRGDGAAGGAAAAPLPALSEQQRAQLLRELRRQLQARYADHDQDD